MRETLIENNIYLSNEQIKKLSKLIKKEDIEKYRDIIKIVDKIPLITTNIMVDEITWRIISSEAIKKDLSPKEMVYKILCYRASQLDEDYGKIYPFIKALKI